MKWPLFTGLAALALGCNSVDLDPTCRGNDDCAGDLVCLDADPRNTCGVPPREGCVSSAECAMGAVCHAIADSCSADDVGSECGPPCSADADCGTSFRCGPDGACAALTCAEGYACLAVEDCDEASLPSDTPVHGRDHRCQKVACSDDSVCPGSGVCVNDICQSSAGLCGELLAVP